MPYDLEPMNAPRAASALLKLLNVLMATPGARSLLTHKLLGDAGILAMRKTPCDEPLPARHPVFDATATAPTGPSIDVEALARTPSAPREPFRFTTVADLHRAYREGATTPEAIADRLIAWTRETEAMTPSMRVFIAQDEGDVRAQAAASAARWKQGKPLSILDGVPVPVKDELDQAGYRTTVGTKFLGTTRATEDATVVARLRAAGAVLVGKTNMHEIGMGVTGLNPNHGSARNPYDPTRATGGSSSGSAAAVAAGFGPLAVGADGGGSIRIPAALCGLVGLKATYGRVSEHGAAPLCWSVAHVGPLAGSAADAALGYALMAGADPRDTNTLSQPAPHLKDFDNPSLAGLRIGLYRPWFEDARSEVVDGCRKLVDGLVERGAQIVELEVPELGLLRTVHLVTIVSEMASSHIAHFERHAGDYGLDTRLNLALARQFQAFDYIHAQRLRVRLHRHFSDALSKCDVLVTPTTGSTAPTLSLDALTTGESNLPLFYEIMRFAPAANLTGFPAVSVPAGYDARGLPIGLQAMGRPWEEHRLLQLAQVAEGMVPRRRPLIYNPLV